MSLVFQPYFHEEALAFSKLEGIAWPNGPICTHCGAREGIGRVTGRGARIALRFCTRCNRQFRVTIGTIFEDSHVPLHKWLQACFLRTCCEYTINPHQLRLTLRITYKTAGRLVDRIDTVLGDRVRKKRRSRNVPDSVAFPRSIRDSDGKEEVLSAEGSEDQSNAFVHMAYHLHPIEDEEAFDRAIEQLIGWRE